LVSRRGMASARRYSISSWSSSASGPPSCKPLRAGGRDARCRDEALGFLRLLQRERFDPAAPTNSPDGGRRAERRRLPAALPCSSCSGKSPFMQHRARRCQIPPQGYLRQDASSLFLEKAGSLRY
jgi:hypothetical protein